jgi:hypothetical protein
MHSRVCPRINHVVIIGDTCEEILGPQANMFAATWFATHVPSMVLDHELLSVKLIWVTLDFDVHTRYNVLMSSMNRTLSGSVDSGSVFGAGGGHSGGLMNMFYAGGCEPTRRRRFTQVPQVSSSSAFDMNRPFHM